MDRKASLDAIGRQDAEGAVKIHEDLDRYRAVIGLTKPDLLIETGTWRGGSARWFANLVERVVTIDVAPKTAFVEDNIALLIGDSVDPKQIRKATQFSRGKRTMVVLDSDHNAPHVQREIEAYAPLVSVGCYLVVEDAIVDEIEPGLGPGEAIRCTLDEDPRFVQDQEIEDMYPATMHPRGWWLRVLASSGGGFSGESSSS